MTRPSRSWPKLRTTLTALRNTSGITTALPRFSQTPSRHARDHACTAGGSRSCDASPRAAPETCGCMWTMSVPSATWMVQGMPARYAASTRLQSACGQSQVVEVLAQGRSPGRARSRRRCGRRRRRRRRSRGPCRTGRPAAARATSSLVLPARASSKSWIAAEPFMRHGLDARRCSIQSIRYGAQPVLMTCPPSAATTVRPSRVGPARVIAQTRRRSLAASCRGKASSQSPTAGPGAHRPAEVLDETPSTGANSRS